MRLYLVILKKKNTNESKKILKEIYRPDASGLIGTNYEEWYISDLKMWPQVNGNRYDRYETTQLLKEKNQ